MLGRDGDMLRCRRGAPTIVEPNRESIRRREGASPSSSTRRVGPGRPSAGVAEIAPPHRAGVCKTKTVADLAPPIDVLDLPKRDSGRTDRCQARF